ncbi:MAG: flippase-like domain-containing protein [Myxococcales bacterium]|nr:flippase-like domain-containing protein [Myxococcales bacterium]
MATITRRILVKRAATVGKAVLMVVVVAFVAWTAWDLAERWRSSPPVTPHLGWTLAAVLPIVGVSLAQALGWLSLMHGMVGRRLPTVPALELFLASMLGRYAPAKVGMPVILMSRAKQLELAPSLMGSSMLLIVLVYTLLGTGIGVATLSLADQAMLPQLEALRSGLSVLALAGMAVGVVVLLVLDRRRYPQALMRKLGVEGEGPLVGLGLVAWYTVVWLCWWAHGALLVHAVGGSWADAGAGAGLFVLAPVLGFLALVAPGGLGVREAVVAGGLSASVGPGPAVVAALLSRIISLAVDVVMWLGFRAVRRRRSAESETD